MLELARLLVLVRLVMGLAPSLYDIARAAAFHAALAAAVPAVMAWMTYVTAMLVALTALLVGLAMTR